MSGTQELNLSNMMESGQSTELFCVNIGNDDSSGPRTDNIGAEKLDHSDLFVFLRDIAENYSETAVNLDNSYNKLATDIHEKLRILETIQKQNEEMERLKREQLAVTHPFQVQQESISLNQAVAERQQELLYLLNQQIENLECLKEDVGNISEKFPKVSDDSEIKSLRGKVAKLLENIAKKMVELMQYKEDIRESFENKSMEERIGFVNLVNQKLTKSVEQMTTEINRVRAEVSNFNFVRATASSSVLSIVDYQEDV